MCPNKNLAKEVVNKMMSEDAFSQWLGIKVLEISEGYCKLKMMVRDNMTNGFGAEIVAQIANIGFKYLDAPVKRVASKDVPIAYAPVLEDSILVQTSWIESAIKEVVEF